MLRGFFGEAAKADLERALKIGLALMLMIAVVSVVVGRQGRLAALQAAAEEELAARAAAQAPVTPATPAAEAPISTTKNAAALPSQQTPPEPQANGLTDGTASAEPPAATPTSNDEPAETAMRLLPRPIALDSGTFLVGAGTIRLIGVEPLAIEQECGEGNGAWPCGMQARTALRGWLRARSISCAVPATFGRQQETVSAECRLGSEDIGLWLIENGWARASDSGRYTIVEKKARDARLGLWRENLAPAEPPAAPAPPAVSVTP